MNKAIVWECDDSFGASYHLNSDTPKGRRKPETSSDGPFEPDPDSTGVGIGR